MITYKSFWDKVTLVLGASIVGRVFFAIVRFFKNFYESSWLYEFITNHNSADTAGSSVIARTTRKLLFKSRFTDFIASSVIVNGVCTWPTKYFEMELSVLGFYLIGSGSVILAACYTKSLSMLFSIVLLVLGAILLFVRIGIGSLIKGSFFLEKITGFFGIDLGESGVKSKKRVKFFAFVIGAVAASVAFALPLQLSVLMILGIAVLPVLISSPFLFLIATAAVGMLISTLLGCLCALVTFCVTLCYLITGRLKLPKLNATYIFAFFYAVLTLYYTFFGFGGSKGIQSGLIQLTMITVFFSAVAILNTSDKIKKFIFAFTAFSSCVGVYGLIQYFVGTGGTGWSDTEVFSGDIVRIFATFGNPNIYGEFLLVAIPFAFAAFLLSKTKRFKVLFALSTLLLIVNLGFTFSRGCYVALIVAVFLIIWHLDKRILGFGLLAIPFVPFVIPKSILARFASISLTNMDTSSIYRIRIWQACLRLIQKYWFLGVGVGAYAFTLFYQMFSFGGTPAQHSHNLFLEITIGLGIVGLITFLLLFIYCIRDARYVLYRTQSKKIKFMLVPAMASLIAIFVQGMFDYIFYNGVIYMTVWLLIAVIVAITNLNVEEVQ